MPRSLIAFLAGTLAAVLLPLSLLSVWVHAVVSDTDRYVETVTPLADDEVIQQAAVDELQREAMELVASTGATLPPGADRLVRRVVEQVVAGPLFRRAWAEASRTAHEQLVAVLEDRSDVQLDDRGRVTIQLGTVLGQIAEELSRIGLVEAGRAVEVDASFAVMDSDQLAKARRGYQLLDTLGFWLPLLWLAAVVLTLLAGRRRLMSASRLAAASVATTGLLALALVFARDSLTTGLPRSDVARAVWDVVVADLWRQIAVTAAILAAVTVVCRLARLGLERRRRGDRLLDAGGQPYDADAR